MGAGAAGPCLIMEWEKVETENTYVEDVRVLTKSTKLSILEIGMKLGQIEARGLFTPRIAKISTPLKLYSTTQFHQYK
jgi:hypothetical protein